MNYSWMKFHSNSSVFKRNVAFHKTIWGHVCRQALYIAPPDCRSSTGLSTNRFNPKVLLPGRRIRKGIFGGEKAGKELEQEVKCMNLIE